MNRQHTRAFTLVEIMIALAIGGVMVAMAYPAYLHYAMKSNRANGVAALMALQLKMERYRADHANYPGIDNYKDELGSVPPSEAYTLQVTSDPDPDAYTLQADAVDERDEACKTLTLSYDGTTTTTSPEICFNR